METVSCIARFAFRIRESMSAIGSVSTSTSAGRCSFLRKEHLEEPFRCRCVALSLPFLGAVAKRMHPSPRALGHPGDCAVVRQLAQADAAELVLAEHGTRTAAAVAAGVRAHRVLGGALLLHPERGLGQGYESLLRSAANGRPSARNSALACSSFSAVVVIATSRPLIDGTES